MSQEAYYWQLPRNKGTILDHETLVAEGEYVDAWASRWVGSMAGPKWTHVFRSSAWQQILLGGHYTLEASDGTSRLVVVGQGNAPGEYKLHDW